MLAEGVVERGVALGAALELVVEVDDQLAERHLELELHALLVEVNHLVDTSRGAR